MNFKSSFHIALLRNFYGKMIKTKPTTLQLIDDKLYRINPKKLSESADSELKELFQLMCKELVFKPLARPLPKKVDYFDVSLLIFRSSQPLLFGRLHNAYKAGDIKSAIKSLFFSEIMLLLLTAKAAASSSSLTSETVISCRNF